MSAIDLTTALARLLSESELRRQFAADRRALAETLAVSEADRPTFLALDERAIEAQAVALIGKRFHEVSKMLPQTLELLGENARAEFDAYAQLYWPTGHRRHLDDACAFAAYLRSRGLPFSAPEANRLEFALQNRRFSIGLVRGQPIAGRARSGIQIIYRLGNQPGEFFLHLAI